MEAKSWSIYDRQQHVVEKALGVGHANGEGDYTDSSERAVAGTDGRRKWIEPYDILHPRLDVADEVAVDEVRRCFAVQSHGELQRARNSRACKERVADARWRRFNGFVRCWSNLGSN